MRNSQKSSEKLDVKKRILSWSIAFVIVFFAIILCCGASMLLVAIGVNSFASAVVTEKDFQNNTARLQHVNSFLPITLPPSTRVTTFEIGGFQDLYMDLEGTIPQSDITAFIQSLPPLDQPSPNVYDGRVGSEYIRIEIDPKSGRLAIRFFQT